MIDERGIHLVDHAQYLANLGLVRYFGEINLIGHTENGSQRVDVNDYFGMLCCCVLGWAGLG